MADIKKDRRDNGLARTTSSRSDKGFYFINGLILTIIMLVVLLPLQYLFSNAFSSSGAVAAGKVNFWPLRERADGTYGIGVALDGFTAVFKYEEIFSGYMNTIIYTALGTTFNMFLTLLAAYPLSRRDLKGRDMVMMLFAFTMIFNGGMAPNYLLLQQLGMLNTRLAIIVPGAISVYNMVICRTFFQSTIPTELLEASQIDGCSDFRFFVQMALPLSKAVIAVIALYYGVAHWNAYFNAFLYLNDKALYPLQIVLKDLLISNTVTAEMLEGGTTGEVDFNIIHVLKYSSIIVACLPIWIIYPFLQKYFTQGVMIGSIKG